MISSHEADQSLKILTTIIVTGVRSKHNNYAVVEETHYFIVVTEW